MKSKTTPRTSRFKFDGVLMLEQTRQWLLCDEMVHQGLALLNLSSAAVKSHSG